MDSILGALSLFRLARAARPFATALILVGALGCRRTLAEPLPVYQDAFLHPHRLAEFAQTPDAVHRIAAFTLTDQNGSPVTAAQLHGHIHVAQFFFARCRTMCPPMFAAMSQVRAAYPADPAVQLVSFTLTPDADSVAALKRLATTRHLPERGWALLTGDHDAIRTLATTSYFVSLGGEGDATQHAGNLVLVDAALRVRGVYAVTRASETERLIADIARLKDESASSVR